MKSLLALLVGAALCSCQKDRVMPEQPQVPVALTYGTIVGIDRTFTYTASTPTVRWRWLVELAAPLTVPGGPANSGNACSVVKTFSFAVSDTAVYRRGKVIAFNYQALPWSPPLWMSTAEWVSSAAIPPRYFFPEVVLSQVQIP